MARLVGRNCSHLILQMSPFFRFSETDKCLVRQFEQFKLIDPSKEALELVRGDSDNSQKEVTMEYTESLVSPFFTTKTAKQPIVDNKLLQNKRVLPVSREKDSDYEDEDDYDDDCDDDDDDDDGDESDFEEEEEDGNASDFEEAHGNESDSEDNGKVKTYWLSSDDDDKDSDYFKYALSNDEDEGDDEDEEDEDGF
ncbi:protein bfr2 isoform X2 [Spinacia oleracea]|uniref:Protein bfr2 isoform X2 n=1 Tax=Spinacia oleracea TaxID=3562 RepID=A0ABM3QHA2_SPIOL|nr:protein bfr2-like isoform X2 [Spinacia oleracea]